MSYDLDIVILAQGSQSRLPDLTIAKQLLALPECGHIPIIGRTLHQIALLAPDCGNVTVVCGRTIRDHLGRFRASIYGRHGVQLRIADHELPDPGNSSLKGIRRYLERANRTRALPGNDIAILLGDVVYSWECLHEILMAASNGRIVGTSDLSRLGGELWGIAYPGRLAAEMEQLLDRALAKHPPFEDTYQPGQLRRWLWEIDTQNGIAIPDGSSPSTGARPYFRAIDDYTRDIDLPEHVAMLPQLSKLARNDDAEHHLRW